ncbi:MAG: autotransporter domain-containing protein [Endomicrobia bacterium]|nr:autotransporter domain-containing protein [Endomicrobiia bacterium]
MFRKLKIKVLMFAVGVLSFAAVDLYAWNVNNYAGLTAAINASTTNITFISTPNIIYTGIALSSITYAGPIDFYGNATLNGGGSFRHFTFENNANANASFYGNINFINGLADTAGFRFGSGGAVHNYVSSAISFTGNTVTFSNNTARYYGGAIYSYAAGVSFTGSSVTFSGNTAGEWGGAIYSWGTVISFTASTAAFNSNAAVSGGAIYGYNAGTRAFTDSNITFIGNRATDVGGAIWNGGLATTRFTNSNIIFSSNTAVNNGGAIYNVEANSNILFTESTVVFNSNTAAGGGAIYNNINANITFTSSTVTFSSNTANRGGAIYNNSARITFTGSTVTFSRNTNGAIANITGSTMTFTNSNVMFSSNTGQAGGALYNDSSNTSFTGSTVTFSMNTAENYNVGGAIHNYTNTVSFTSSTAVFSSNTAYSGGAIHNNSGATMTFTNSSVIFGSNIAVLAGGAIYNSGALNFDTSSGNIIFMNNTAAEASLGNDIYNEASGTMTITGLGNSVEINGGIAGAGLISKTGNNLFLLNADNSYYTGTFNQTAGTATVTAAGRMFGGTNNITDSLLQVTGDGVYYTVNLGNDSVLEHYNLTSASTTIDGSSITFTGSGAKAVFGKDAGLTVNANYILANKIGNANVNTVEFNNSNVSFGTDDYTGTTIYGFNNSVIDITGNSSSTRTVTFDNFSSSNTVLNFALNFFQSGSNIDLFSDMLAINNTPQTDGLLLGNMKILNDQDNGLHSTYTVTVLSGIEFQSGQQKAIATTVYEYLAEVDSSLTGIELSVVKEADEYSLNAMNVYSGDRGFNFSFFAALPNIYNIGASLDDMAAGTFTVQGYDSDATHSVISGALKSSPTVSGSLFNMVNATDLMINDLTIEDAYISGSGSVLRITNAAAAAELNNVIIQNNEAGSSGGAIYNGSGQITITDSQFTGNEAGVAGGAIYMSGISNAQKSEIEINALSQDVIFSNNEANGLGNDIHLDGYSALIFNAAANQKISITGGITGNGQGNLITKTGSGILELDGSDNATNYNGELKIEQGIVNVLNDTDITIGKLELQSGTKYSTNNGLTDQTTYVGDAVIGGELEIDVDLTNSASDKLAASAGTANGALGNIFIENTGMLNLNVYGTSSIMGIGSQSITLMEAGGGISGTFGSVSGLPSSAGNLNYMIEYFTNKIDLIISKSSNFLNDILNLTHNQTEVARTFDTLSKYAMTAEMAAMLNQIDTMANNELKKEALDQLSGAFYANALTLGAARSGADELYARMKPRICPGDGSMSKSVWGQFYVNSMKYGEDLESAGDFMSNGYGAQIGADLLIGEKSFAGVYAGYGMNKLEQGKDSADVNDADLGIYGAWFGDIINIKGSLTGGMQSFSAQRDISFAGYKTKADFNTYGIRADVQGEYVIKVAEKLDVKPFIGMQGGFVSNPEIKESNGGPANLVIEAGSYMRLTGLAGLGIGGDMGKFNWYAKMFAGYIMVGNNGEITARYEQYNKGKEMEIQGADQGNMTGGAGIGGEYKLGWQWSVYATANANFGENISGYYGNVGINYRFCDKETLRKLKEAQEAEKAKKAAEAEEAERAKLEAEEAERLRQQKMAEEMNAAMLEQKRLEAEERRKAKLASFNLNEATFEVGEYGLNEAAKKEIEQLAKEAKEYNFKKITIEGHTDNTGSFRTNQDLSRKRAEAVFMEFAEQGIPKEKMEYVGFADKMPIADNKTEEGKAKNRRTEIYVE